MKQAIIAPDNNYNFSCDYEVVLDHPIDEVFKVLGNGDNVEAVVRLSSICTTFETFTDKSDFVATPNDAPLSATRVRTLPSAPPSGQGNTQPKLYPRRHFHFCERVKILWGIASTDVHLYGTHTWDEAGRVALYETKSPQGVEVWKLRRFEEVEKEGTKGTKIMESIRGTAPVLLKSIVQKEATQQHRHVVKTILPPSTRC